MDSKQALELSHRPSSSDELVPAAEVAYSYLPLDHSKQQIRLFTLLPSADPDSSFRGSFALYDLDSTPSFRALSYVWGSPDRAHTVEIEGSLVPIGENLFQALRRLRGPSEPHILWIDALCINQHDSEERNHQIRMVANIYGAAEQLVIWLGEVDDNTERTLWIEKSMNKPQAGSGDMISFLDRDRLRSIKEQPWFKRVWVHQEIWLARECIFLYGDETFTLELLASTLGFGDGSGLVSEEDAVELLKRFAQSTEIQMPHRGANLRLKGTRDIVGPSWSVEDHWPNQDFASDLDSINDLETVSTLGHEGSSLGGTTLIDPPLNAPRYEIPEHTAEGQGYPDYVSLVSNDEDIASRAPRLRSEPELLAVKVFGAFFAENDELRAVHVQLIEKLGVSRFVNNYRRSLKTYTLKLRSEARTALEKDAVKVLERRENRRTIALQIVDYTMPDHDETRGRFDDLAQQALQKQLLEDWASNAYGPPDTAPAVVELPDDYSEGHSDGEDHDLHFGQLSALTPTNVDKACAFLRNEKPMQVLSAQLRLLSLSSQLIEILDTTPRDTINISKGDDTTSRSVTNLCKIFVEDWTQSPWEWWPLQKPVPIPAKGHMRLRWEFCGEPLYAEVSEEEVRAVNTYLQSAKQHPPRCSCCRPVPPRMKWSTIVTRTCSSLGISSTANSTGSTVPSTAQARYTPAGSTSSSTSTLPQQPTASPASLANSSGNNIGVQPQNCVQPNFLWIVFGIEDIVGFHAIENIETHVHCDDPTFFQELKTRHQQHRWFFQRWLSPYLFRYCRFVQFDEVLNEHISCIGEALPEDHGYTTDYEYAPRPPIARKPLIERDRFAAILRACGSPCYWSLLPIWMHKCRHVPDERRYMSRIPQKKAEYRSSPHVRQTDRVAFGIQAGYMPSVAVFFVYHAVLVLAGFGFWIWWLNKHPSDLQNAAVPLFTVGMLITSFWALFGKQMGAL